MTAVLIFAGCFVVAGLGLLIYDTWFNPDPRCPGCAGRNWERYAHTTDIFCRICGTRYDPAKHRAVSRG